MACYSIGGNGARAGIGASVTAGGGGLTDIRISSIQISGENNNAAAAINRMTVIFGSDNPVVTGGNKFNNESATPNGAYGSGNGTPSHTLIVGLLGNTFNRGYWSPRGQNTIISSYDGSNSSGSITTLSGTPDYTTVCNTVIAKESTEMLTRPIRGRRCRQGMFNTYGTFGMNLHSKTGGGAFTIFTPKFDANITWLDGSSYKLGFFSGDVWSMQMYGTPAVIRIPRTTSIGHPFII